MNSLMNYFSPTKLEPPPVQVAAIASSSKEPIPTPSKARNGSKPKTPQSEKADSRQIISNMESVINSVNKKHRHRKKKDSSEMNKSEPEITDISNILSSSLKFISPNASLEKVKIHVPESKENVANNVVKRKRGRPRKQNGKDSSKSTSLKENENSKRSKSVEKSLLTSQTNSIENNGSSGIAKENSDNENTTFDQENSEEKPTPKTNAFTLLMNARNRVIGSNQSGQEVNLQEASASMNPEKAKRKLVLEAWAEKKGGAKRKLAEVEREEYIEYEMEKRAKRLKRMLVPESHSSKTSKKRTTKKTSQALNEVEDMNNAFLISSSQESLAGEEHEEVEKKTVKTGRKKPIASTSQDVATPDNRSTPKSAKTSSKSRKRRSKRVSSVQSDKGSTEMHDTEFIQNLSSPIKKRDSLLGYFPKVTPPKDDEVSKENVVNIENGPVKEETTKRPSRKLNKGAKEDKLKVDVIAVADSPRSRPRRSCAGRIRYDEEFNTSPKEEEQVRTKRQKASISNIGIAENNTTVNSEGEDVICLDTTDDNVPNKRATKLAPVFVKNVPKPAIDPAVLEAKKNFLMSGIPEKMKLEIVRQKQFEESFEMSLESMFPKISHVGCESEKGSDTNRAADWENCGVLWREMTNSPDRPGRPKEENTLKPYTPLKGPLNALEKLEDVENKVDLVKSLKVTYAKFPTYRCYKQLRAKYKQTKNMAVQQYSDSFVILNTNNKATEDVNDTSFIDEVMFTEKYKPISSEQVLVNHGPVNKLKEFLSSWQNGRSMKMNESSNDFDISSDSLSSGISNTVVLYGPSSSGKTNAVFALANEMNFNVLEINAGMKRSGKKLLQELQEATQSHLVNNDKSSLLKRSFNGGKINFADGNDSSSVSELGAAKLSLILVEDADIVFEQDAGFIEAIHQLIATSKRPVVIVSNTAECPHLVRLQRQFSIEFPAPNVLSVSKFLSVMSLVENCPVELDDIIRLYLHNGENLRRTILEIQFFIQSGGDRDRRRPDRSCLQSPRKFLSGDISDGCETFVDDAESTYKPPCQDVYTHQTLFDFYTINQNSDFIVQFPVDFECLYQNLADIFVSFKKPPQNVTRKRRKSKKSLSEAEESSSQSLDDIILFYENVSVASYITPSVVKDRLCENVQETISHTIVEKTIRNKLNNSLEIDLTLKKKSKRPSIVPLLSQNCMRTNRSVDLDYEPMLRSICRSEKTRATVERRGSRFYHYLRNICTNTNSFSTNDFDNTCSVLNASNGENDRLNSDG